MGIMRYWMANRFTPMIAYLHGFADVVKHENSNIIKIHFLIHTEELVSYTMGIDLQSVLDNI